MSHPVAKPAKTDHWGRKIWSYMDRVNIHTRSYECLNMFHSCTALWTQLPSWHMAFNNTDWITVIDENFLQLLSQIKFRKLRSSRKWDGTSLICKHALAIKRYICGFSKSAKCLESTRNLVTRSMDSTVSHGFRVSGKASINHPSGERPDPSFAPGNPQGKWTNPAPTRGQTQCLSELHLIQQKGNEANEPKQRV